MSAVESRLPHNVSFSDDVVEEVYNAVASSSSVVFVGGCVPSSFPGEKSGVTPLGPARTVALTRRAVIFSPRNDTKYFHSSDSIVPEKNAPPPSIRSYHNQSSDGPSPDGSPSSGRPSVQQAAETPLNFRSILKQRVSDIRVAASVAEGTLNNKEAARLLVSGKRPKLMAMDSFQLAMMRKAAGDGPEGVTSAKGKERMVDEVPGSDDSSSSDEAVDRESGPREGSWEEEEQIEEDGALATGSLVNILLEGAEDLLTLEEAYATLTLRLRQRIPIDNQEPSVDAALEQDIRLATHPIRDEAPAMIRAIQRDLSRLLGKVPNSEVPSSEADSSPFRGLMPTQDTTPNNQRSRFTPSPTPPMNGARRGLDGKEPRQGYTESEVRYRREASGVGAAALRFLAFTFHTPHIYNCFTEADLAALLEQILIIPRTPKLPTPNPKRTYYLAVLLIAQMRIPLACILPAKEKLVRAIESAMNDTVGASSPGAGAKEGPTQIRKEAYHAVTNLMTTYPTTFFPFYADLLPGCLRALAHPMSIIRNRAAAAVTCFAASKYAILSDPANIGSRDAWARTKSMVQKSEYFVVSHLKSALKIPGKTGPVYTSSGEKKTEWSALEQIFKDTVGTTDVHWACAVWAMVVSLIGGAYGSCGLAESIDHIMDRSLQPSTNAVRPLLARVAWNHAIHAHLSAGSASSYADDGHIIQSYKPFASSSKQDISERIKTIQMPVDLALAMALDTTAYSRKVDHVTGMGSWQRSEKTKKFQWMITCGLGAAGIIYAYTGMAIHHEDQPAKEMTAISGLPSSDGAPVPESSLEENKLDRLDKTWDNIAEPILTSLSSVCGVDKLKIHGWAIFEAIVSPSPPAGKWRLDRLLSIRYLNGEAFSMDKDEGLNELLDGLNRETIRPSEIPAWGSNWVTSRLDKLLDLFEAGIGGMHGIADLESIKWVSDDVGNRLLPQVLSRIWSRMLECLVLNKGSPEYLCALKLLTRHLVQLFNRDVQSYVPVGMVDAEGSCSVNPDMIRIGIFTHLFSRMVTILGREAVGATRLSFNMDHAEDNNDIDEAIVTAAYGTDAEGKPTIAGCLLGQLLKTQALAVPLDSRARTAFSSLLWKVLDAGSIPGFHGKLLGDMTNQLPWIFAEQEEVQLDVWRLLARKWTETIDLQPAVAASSTNHTGALLVSLLSGPFRGRQVTSVWHQHANEDNLAVWQALLQATVLRYRAKRVGSNLGVLESLAGHLGDFLGEAEKTSSTTITLSCLASAVSWISFVPSEAHHQSHYSLNENFVPIDFLTLVASALIESYPQSETLATEGGAAISPAVRTVLINLGMVFKEIPVEFVGQVFQPVKSALAVWMSDEARIVVDEELSACLDNLYITLLQCLGNASTAGCIPATSETLDDLIDIYAPRLSRAQSPAVPIAFQSFWRLAFQGVQMQYSDDVAEFLRDVIAAVPGMIEVHGVNSETSFSEEESQARFPHALTLKAEAAPSLEQIPEDRSDVLVDMTVEISVADIPEPIAEYLGPTAEYDADVSQSYEDAVEPDPEPEENTAVENCLTKSPNPSDTDSEQVVSDETSSMEIVGGGDVFGPTALMMPPKRRKGRVPRPLSNAESMPEPEIKRAAPPDEPISSESLPAITAILVEDSDDDLDECIQVSNSPMAPKPSTDNKATIKSARPSLISSATRWLGQRVPSIGGLFSPTHAEFASTDSTPTSTLSSDRSARRAKRNKRKSDTAEAEGAPSVKRLVPVVDLTTTKRSRTRSLRNTPSTSAPEIKAEVINIEEDDDDELLLSPESARKRRREEESDIAVQRARSVPPSPSPKRTKRIVEGEDPASLSRFADAPEDTSSLYARQTKRQTTPGPSRIPVEPTAVPSPSARTDQQARVLDMVEKAARAKNVIESLALRGFWHY